MHVYFNPLDNACKSVVGAIPKDKRVQLNIFCLKNRRDKQCAMQTPNEEDCYAPEENAFLSIHQDDAEEKEYSMQKTAFGWSITLFIQNNQV